MHNNKHKKTILNNTILSLFWDNLVLFHAIYNNNHKNHDYKTYLYKLSLLIDNLTSGCGLSKKLNKKTNTTFLYFWKYKDGKKTEKYIGRADDKEAEIKGAKIMLEFFQNQDKELHKIIKNLETKIMINNTQYNLLTPKSSIKIKKRPHYLPDFED